MNSEPQWGMFKGRPNTDELLREKAAVVARLVAMDFDTAEILASKMNFTFGEVEAALAKAEVAALWLYVIDKLYAFKLLSASQRDLFMKKLEEDIVEKLRPFGIVRLIFEELLVERYAEYSSYEFAAVNEQGHTNGTLLWEFDKKVSAILGVGKSAYFNTYHSALVLRQLERWQLHTLISD